MILYTFPDPETVATKAADYFIEAAEDAISEKGKFCVALSGGSTPRLVHRALAIDKRLTDEMIEKIHWFWGDERPVEPTHEESNVRMAFETLLGPRRVSRANVHAPRGHAPNLDSESLHYELEIKKVVPLSPTGHPRFDLVFLGMGTDGHTASLFPGTKALDETLRTYVANEVPQLETKRLTLTFGAINSAANVIVLVAGKDKAEMLDEVCVPRSNPTPRYPVQRVRAHQGPAIFLADHAATRTFTTEQRKFYNIDY